METTKSNPTKKYKYYTSCSFTDTKSGKEQSFITQLYQIGVYCIWNNNPALQGGMMPSAMASMCKKIQKDADAGEITNLKWGREITVTQEDSFWVEVK